MKHPSTSWHILVLFWDSLTDRHSKTISNCQQEMKKKKKTCTWGSPDTQLCLPAGKDRFSRWSNLMYLELLVHYRCNIHFKCQELWWIFITLTDIQLLETTYDPVLHKCQSFPNANSSKESFPVCVAMTSGFLCCHWRPDWYQGGIQSNKSPVCVQSHPVDVRLDWSRIENAIKKYEKCHTRIK